MDWYEELDYEENPFKDNEDTELIGYEEVIDEVLYRLMSGNMVCVEGKSGAGKTAILKAAINKFKGDGQVVYINGQQLTNGLNIENVLKKKAGVFKRIFNKKPKKMILLLDEIQNLSERNCERIKYYFDNNFIKSAIFTSSDFKKANFTTSLKERISKTINLREVSEDEAIDIVQSRLGSDEIIPETVIKEIFSRSDKNMKSFLKNCEKACSFAFESNGKTVLPEHLNEIFDEDVVEEQPEESKEKDSEKQTKKTKKKSQKKSKSKKKDDPKEVVEEPVTVSIVDDFKPQKKEVKMEDEIPEEEIDIDSELKKLSKANKLDEEDDLSMEDYEEDYKDFKDEDEDEEDEVKKVDDDNAEKYY